MQNLKFSSSTPTQISNITSSKNLVFQRGNWPFKYLGVPLMNSYNYVLWEELLGAKLEHEGPFVFSLFGKVGSSNQISLSFHASISFLSPGYAY
jgi:hypothetical protein